MSNNQKRFISEIFEEEPEQYGLRDDDYLWKCDELLNIIWQIS